MKRRGRNVKVKNKENDDKYVHDNDAPLVLDFKDIFKTYPSLLTKEQLVNDYPWSNERITYNYIMTSYRQPNNSIKSCILSFFTIHNELVNQWTHFLGAVTTICLLIVTVTTVTDIEPSIILSSYCILGTFMFSCSSSYHTFCCHSDNGSRVVQCMDWLGIAMMTFACNFLSSYYELREFRTAFYIFTAFNLIFGLLSYSITSSALNKVYLSADIQKGVKFITERKAGPKIFQPFLDVMETYAFRSFVGIFYALGSILAWIIGVLLRGSMNDHLPSIIIMYSFYFTVALCLLDIPEKLVKPGTLDIIGFSHQLFHLGIFAGVVSQWFFFYNIQQQYSQ